MARCEECIHSMVCVIRGFPSAFENTHWEKEPCDHFKAADVAPRAEWISVEERLPDNGETVLTVDNEGYMIVASWYELGGWFLPVCRANPVTHWMPLPSAPKKEKNND